MGIGGKCHAPPVYPGKDTRYPCLREAGWATRLVCTCAENLVPTAMYVCMAGRDGVVGIETRYGLDGLGIESRWERDFPHLSRPVVDSTQLPTQRALGLFPGRKAVRA
jgi:hypothetical protein